MIYSQDMNVVSWKVAYLEILSLYILNVSTTSPLDQLSSYNNQTLSGRV